VPELPEVETVVRDLRALKVVGQTIRRVEVRWERTVAGMRPEAFIKRLHGRRITGIARRAKYIVVSLSGGWTLLIHLRMTGQFELTAPGAQGDKHEHVVLRFAEGRELRFRDTRKFGRWILTRNPDAHLARLGPEPLGSEFRAAEFAAAVRKHRRQLKPLLLDQTFVAGLGNIYADEVLWKARLHPRRRSDRLTLPEAGALHRAIRDVLRRAIRNRGTSLGMTRTNFRGADGRRGRHQLRLNVFQRTGAPCARCGSPIRRLLVAQRSTHICPQCQRP